jgi:hypothetical protein
VERLSRRFEALEALFGACDIDYEELQGLSRDESLFDSYERQRIVNSFLFNYMKIQDKLGSKLFRELLIELREIEDESVPMRDLLDRLERLRILGSVEEWNRLREVRNLIAHEYPLDIAERLENIEQALHSYPLLKDLFGRIVAAAGR